MALPPIGFWSYSTHDETESNGRISRLHDFVQRELRQKMGRGQTVEIWRDTSGMRSGAAWEAEINRAVDRASFLIAVVTPDFLNSKWCCHEVMRFHARVDALGRTDLLFPLHVVDTDDLSHDEVHDPALLNLLRARQMFDFRRHRLKPEGDPDVEAALDRFTTDIRTALRAGRAPPTPILPVVQSPPEGGSPAPSLTERAAVWSPTWATAKQPTSAPSPSLSDAPTPVPSAVETPLPRRPSEPEVPAATATHGDTSSHPADTRAADSSKVPPKRVGSPIAGATNPPWWRHPLAIIGAVVVVAGVGAWVAPRVTDYFLNREVEDTSGPWHLAPETAVATPAPGVPPPSAAVPTPPAQPTSDTATVLPLPPVPPTVTTAQPQPAPRCPQCPEMVLIPGGSFTMGDKEFTSSQPETPITIKPFFMAKYPVTVGEYRAFLTARPTYQVDDDWKDAAKDPAPRLPAVYVNQADCKAYHD